jgi:cell division protease FtsH
MIIYLLILVAMVAIFFNFILPSGGPEHMDTGELLALLKAQGGEVTVKEQTLTAKIGDDEYKTTVPKEFDAFTYFEGSDNVDINYKGSSGWGSWASILINFLPLILFGALILFIMRQAQGGSNQAMSFGKSKARMVTGDKPTITFDDVAGVEEAKQELQEVVEFLKFPEKFIALGARIPSGVCCSSGRRALARPCLLAPLPGKQAFLSSPSVAASSSRCLSAWARHA